MLVCDGGRDPVPVPVRLLPGREEDWRLPVDDQLSLPCRQADCSFGVGLDGGDRVDRIDVLERKKG